jgi:hypothetical protein
VLLGERGHGGEEKAVPWELGNCKFPGGVGEARWDACMARVKVQRREREQEKNDRGREKAKEVREREREGD